MAFQVRSGTLDDLSSLCEIYLAAFKDDALSLKVFPRSSDSGAAFWRTQLSEEITDADSHFLVVTDTSSTQPNAPIAFAKWVAPGAATQDAPGPEIWPQDGNPALAVKFFSVLADGHRRIMGDTRHWYLEMLAVRPEYQGRGVASPLMRWGLEKADGDEVQCFLEGTTEARGVYERFGFEVVDEAEIDVEGSSVVELFMIRGVKTN